MVRMIHRLKNIYMQNNSTNNWDPCISQSFNDDKIIIITFDYRIENFNVWYPLSVCNIHNESVPKYRNEYLFDGGQSLTRNNLIINDYTISNSIGANSYSIIRSSIGLYQLTVGITCNDCVLMNVTSLTSMPLIHTKSHMHLVNAQFHNIWTATNIIHSERDNEFDAFISRNLTLANTLFVNIKSDCIMYIEKAEKDVK